MKQRITAAELKAMTMKELAAWVEFNACAINRTMVMSWGHEELFKEYHIRPEYIGYKAGRLIVMTFHFTSRTRKADAQSFAEWLHWAIFGEYPAEETTETAEQVEETETEETEAETIEETAEEAKEVATMKKYFKVTFEYAEDIYCTNLAHAETAEDVEREYSKYPWKSIKEAQPWDVDEAKMKGMPIIEVEAAQEAPQEAPAAEAGQQPTETENAPQAATQAADNDSTTDNTPAITEAIENAHKSRYSARQTAPLTFAIWDNVKNIPVIETTSNGITAYMDIFGINHIDADTAEPTGTDTEEEEEEDTMTITNTITRVNFETARETIQSASRRSAWARGVRDYALDLLEDLEDWTIAGDVAPNPITDDIDNILRNGAKSWKDYSWGGCALIYDSDICRRLCNNTEKKITRNGERRPNAREEWLDVQARALFQAAQMVCEAVRAATVTISTTETVEAVEEATQAVTVA